MPTTSKNQLSHWIESAEEHDVPYIEAIVRKAYQKYVDRIGRPPAPMEADYHSMLRSHEIFVLRVSEDPGREPKDTAGAIVLLHQNGSLTLQIENIVTDPKMQGHGFGRILLQHAEDVARGKGCSALTLYTNAKMNENFPFYAKMGFTEVDRRNEDGYDRVYYQKDLVI